ncbi:MAG TPA: hypothetical protein VK791_05890, partial [bacterium]|nr:hypothetical protein [bacterium]
MNILLWVLQILLGFYYLMGGSWMVFKVPAVWLKIMPKPAWMAIGMLQMLFALGLILPGATGMWLQLTPIAAIGVAVETMLTAPLTKPKLQGMFWLVIPALLSAFVAYGRL